MDAAALVKQARRSAGMTQEALAEGAGVRRQTVSLVESGTRQPSLGTLVGLLAAAGLQMRVELEPLDEDVRRQIEERRAAAEPAADVVATWEGFVTFLAMEHVAYRVEGLAAAALLGAPVQVTAVGIALADCDDSYRWLARHVGLGLLAIRVDGRWGALDMPVQRRWAVPESPDGETAGGAVDDATVAAVRARLWDACPDGRFRLQGGLDEVGVRMAPRSEVARVVRVSTSAGTIAVQPLDEVESADPAAARVLRVMRAAAPAV